MRVGPARHNAQHFTSTIILIIMNKFFSLLMQAKQLNSEGRFRRAGKYSRGALACNCLACCQYMVFVLAAVAVFVFVVLGVRVTL